MIFPRAAAAINTAPTNWQRQVSELSASALYSIGDELAAMIRHPAYVNRPAWANLAAERLGVIMTEMQKRWEDAWYHESNSGIMQRLFEIYRTT